MGNGSVCAGLKQIVFTKLGKLQMQKKKKKGYDGEKKEKSVFV